MSQVKILYVRNLMLTTTEESLKDYFSHAAGGCEIERVKKIRDYAFVHFRSREDALKAMNATNGSSIEGSQVEVVLAKPVDKSDIRLAKTRGFQVYGLEGYEAAAAAASFTPQAFSYGQMIPQAGRGIQRGALALRGMTRGRGRGAAGSRGAGGTRMYMPNTCGAGFRRHPVAGRLYDVLPGMELIPTNPITLKPQTMKTSVQVLEEFCQKNGLGCPVYQLHSTMQRGPAGQEDLQLFLFKVSIPALITQSTSPYQPDKLCRTVDEARVYAAEFTLLQLGVPFESSEVSAVTQSSSTPSAAAAAVGGFHGGPLAPLTFASSSRSLYSTSMPIVTTASYVVPGNVLPRGFDYSQAASFPPPAQATGPAVYQTY